MLQKLVFELNDRKIQNPAARGSLIRKDTGDDSEFAVFTDPTHPFNEQYGWEEAIVYYVKELEPGIYLGGFSFGYTIDMLTNFKTVNQSGMLRDGSPYNLIYHDGRDKEASKHNRNILENSISEYGVADNIEQIKEQYKEAIDHPTNKIVISVTSIRKKDEPEFGGWRWHKWGEYIGTQTPTTEYIYDEPEIEEVLVFHVYMVKEVS